MEEDIHEYQGQEIDVTFDSNRCIHARTCVEGLPAVFDTSRRPWVDPDRADPGEVAAVVEQCPTGALQYDRRDGGEGETPPETNIVRVVENGPLYLHGDIEIRTNDGETLFEDTRVALCRCGHSGNKPVCDNSHQRVFDADGRTAEPAGSETIEGTENEDSSGETSPRRLTVTLVPNGPFQLEGPFVLQRPETETRVTDGAALCRCGASSAKPLCDGSHAEEGFSTASGE